MEDAKTINMIYSVDLAGFYDRVQRISSVDLSNFFAWVTERGTYKTSATDPVEAFNNVAFNALKVSGHGAPRGLVTAVGRIVGELIKYEDADFIEVVANDRHSREDKAGRTVSEEPVPMEEHGPPTQLGLFDGKHYTRQA